MGNIIRLPGGVHADIQSLLPWYVTGQLDLADQERVEAHVTGCRECATQLEQDSQLGRELMQQPGDVEQGWAAMRDQLDLDRGSAAQARSAPRHIARPSTPRSRWSWLGWTVGPQLVLASCIGAFFLVQAPRYTALDGGTAPAGGNLIVIFEPDITEQSMRETLRASEARLVDGPTAANAYVLHVPPARRDRLLAGLRGRPQIVLAEPIDAGGQP